LDHIKNADNPEVVKQLRTATAFFFGMEMNMNNTEGGGDQSRLITCFYKNGRQYTLALDAIREMHLKGAVIAGSSAGEVYMTFLNSKALLFKLDLAVCPWSPVEKVIRHSGMAHSCK